MEVRTYLTPDSDGQTPSRDFETAEALGIVRPSARRLRKIGLTGNLGKSERKVTQTASNRVEIPWGVSGETIELQLPVDWPEAEVVRPDLSVAIDDYARALEQALDRPLGMEPIESFVGAGKTVSIVVDDPSRWTPVCDVLPVVLRRLSQAGVRDDDVSISVGVGRHHAVDDSAMRERVGPAVFERYVCHSPPVDDLSKYEDLGKVADNIPVRVFRPVARADLRILIGSVLPHLQAGFGGGYKLIFPGASHRSTLGALHRRGINSGDTGRRLGESASVNPMRQAIQQAATLLGPCVSISHLLGARGQVFDVVSGHPDEVQDRLASEVKRRFRAPDAPLADILVAGNSPWPGDPMQSFKVLLNHRAATKPGGVLIGLFWANDEELDRSFPLPALKAIALTGNWGGWALRKGLALADAFVSHFHPSFEFMVKWARELVVDRTILIYSPLLFEKIGTHLGPIRVYREMEPLWRDARRALGENPLPSIRVFPQAGLTYAPETSERL